MLIGPEQLGTALPESSQPAAASSGRPLRVLCLNYEYPPMGGGAGNATRHTAAELRRRGHTVHVLTSRTRGDPALEVVDDVPLYRVRSLRRSIHECGMLGALSYLLLAFLELRRLARRYRYDVYQFYFGLPTGLLALYVDRVLNKPYVLALRGSDVPGYDERTSWYMAPLHRLLRPLTRHLWRRAASVTVLSEDLGRLARRTEPRLNPVVIPNGNDAHLFPLPAKPRAASDAFRLICVCRLVRRKGLEDLLTAMHELRHHDVTLEIVGTGKEHGALAASIEARGLGERVKLRGYVPREQLHDYYHRADVFVLPSLSESFGQVLLEAMSCGLPVIATRTGGIPETLHHARNGLLIPPGDPKRLARAVLWMKTYAAERMRMGRYNGAYVRAHYDWANVAARYEGLHRDACGRGMGDLNASTVAASKEARDECA